MKNIKEKVLKDVFAGLPDLFKDRDRKFVERAIDLTLAEVDKEDADNMLKEWKELKQKLRIK